uniref:Uncharacterized protein LOC100369531 isoform X2 n=1 Tax=Saccoglossus kowalevskii TaxID=10224 RepID=A0ABM0MMA6_SACKO|nr:PREDICTED: uncharacterized protein LOC100369531 isoform X2 [Saccoglossus kowalevskii]
MKIRFVRVAFLLFSAVGVPSLGMLPIVVDEVPTCPPNYYSDGLGQCEACETCKELTRPPSGCKTSCVKSFGSVNYVVVGVSIAVVVLVAFIATVAVLLIRRQYKLRSTTTDTERQDRPTQTDAKNEPTGTPSTTLFRHDGDDDTQASIAYGSMEQGTAEHWHRHIGTETNEGHSGPASSTADYSIVRQ